MPFENYCIAFFVVTLAAVLQSVSGIGLALVAAPVLVLIDADFLPGPILTMGCCLSALTTWRYRRTLHLGDTLLALYGRIPGSLTGLVLLSMAPQSAISLGFGVLIIASVILSYRRVTVEASRNNLLVAGFFSGMMGTTTSVGGPPMALVYQNSDPETVRAQLGFYFLIGTGLSIMLLAVSGNYSMRQLGLVIPLVPAVILGFLMSIFWGDYLNRIHIKPLIAAVSVGFSLLIIWRAMGR